MTTNMSRGDRQPISLGSYNDAERPYEGHRFDTCKGSRSVLALIAGGRVGWDVIRIPGRGLFFCKIAGRKNDSTTCVLFSPDVKRELKKLLARCMRTDVSHMLTQKELSQIATIEKALAAIAGYEDERARKPAKVGHLIHGVFAYGCGTYHLRAHMATFFVAKDQTLTGEAGEYTHLRIANDGTAVEKVAHEAAVCPLGQETDGMFWTTSMVAAKRCLKRFQLQEKAVSI